MSMTREGVRQCLSLLQGAIEDDRPKAELIAMCQLLSGQLEVDQTFDFLHECLENDISIPIH